jgi:hypothetical protein
MRRHAWYLFAGLTQTAKSGAAIWETWYPEEDTLTVGPQPQGLTGGDRPPRQFEIPFQLRSQGAQPQAAGESLLSFVLFNQEAHDFIRSNQLNRKSKLTELNNAFPAGTPLAKREIAPFPRPAVALKTVWTLVKASQARTLPVWDGVFQQPDEGFPSGSWPRAVVIDPSRTDVPMAETRQINWHGKPLDAHVVPVSRFYNFKISAAELPAVKALIPAAEEGDFAILLMMHVTTKEIPDWVWSTYWWHDRPDEGAFGADRPAVVTGVWRNYRMDSAYDMDRPREYDGTPNVAFNPYLENFDMGAVSNCMTCHRQSRWTPTGAPNFIVTRGAPAADDPMFKDSIKADFLWAIPTQAQ